ncbi:MAG TPA: phospholipase D-like domain-containing protein [Candidatus Nanoarchaeia archaeon]|nr:phospholipase D-like domain-containing protein [Candidatus Nanoarchaeia archaeon]
MEKKEKRASKLVIALILLVALFAYSYFLIIPLITGSAVAGRAVKSSAIVSEDLKDISVYFCAVENCTEVFSKLIKSSKKSVHCAIYDLTVPVLISDFREKSKSADVKILVDDGNFRKVRNLEFVRQDDASRLSHNKFCIFDDSVVLTGSTNPTRNIEENDNNIVVVTSAHLSENYEQEFSELWSGRFGGGNRVRYPGIALNGTLIENYFCPEDNCAGHMMNILSQANKSIYFMTFSFTHDEIEKMLIERHNAGIEVSGVFEKSQLSEWSAFYNLNRSGIEVKLDNNKYNMHHKVWIIDKKIVITGSMNPTLSGDSKNDENILIIHDKEIAGLYADEFSRLFR